MTDQQERWLPPAAPGEQPPMPPVAGLPGDSPPQSRLRRALGPVFVVFALIAKWAKGALIVLKGAKFLTTSATMLVSVAAYALIWGWRFGVGFVALLFIHEFGHYIQLRREGIRPGRMLFIPFFGAVVSARSLGGNALAEARVGLAGPVLGTLGALACIPIAHATGNDLWRALAFSGLFLNLFNLLPVVPLDGGRAMAAMSPWMWFLGLAAVAVLAFTFPNPIILLIALLAVMETWRRWRALKSGDRGVRAYYRVRPLYRGLVAAVYLGLIALLVLGMDATHVARTLNDV